MKRATDAWIACAERMPQAAYGPIDEKPIISEDVLVYFEAGECAVEICYYDHNTEQWGYSTELGEHPDADPTHWMPLPNAPIIEGEKE